eukprot:gene22293-27256_t
MTTHGFDVLLAEDGRSLDRILQRETIDLIVLDLMLPGEDGLSICRRMRGAGNKTPIIMLTAKGEEVERINGLEIGADDYLGKPFNPRELLARIHAVLRRRPQAEVPGAPASEQEVVTFSEFTFDLGARSLSKNGQDIALTTGEFAMLKALVRHPRQPLTREKLAHLARGRDFEPFDRSLDVQISRLRKMLELDPASPKIIQTVWGVGYVFVPDGQSLKLSLFWRTFFLLALLILCSSLAWLQMFRTQEYEPRILRNAHQIATVVNLTRTALMHTDAIARVSLLKSLADEEDVSILTREPGDRIVPFGATGMEKRLIHEMVERLGPGTVIASQVNEAPGLWVGFQIERDSYWLQMDPQRLQPLGGSTWLIWLLVAMALSLTGAAVMAGLINRPLKRLSLAASQLREGHFNTSTLDEDAPTSEIREVNIGFNRMAERLAKIEAERALMLAGISHDLRTPLARLRLETELSVNDPETRELMAADIAQLDEIIDKFLDYARPEPTNLGPVLLSGVISRCIAPFRVNPRMDITVDVAEDLHVKAETVELGRVLSNLLENARRYGQSPSDGITRVEIVARVHDGWVLLRVRDQGPGVSEDTLKNLTQPFYRGDTARTSATGSGLGLAIVERSVQRMGGTFSVFNNSAGGLMALMKFRQTDIL